MEEYIIDAFSRVGNNTNLEVNNLNVDCITSSNNNFSLDSNGNLTVNSINTNNLTGTGFLNFVYPVGSIYISVNSANPSTLFGGQWEAFGTGRTLVGINTNDTAFNSSEKVGGIKEQELRALIGNIDSDTSRIGYVTSNPVPGQNNYLGYGYSNLNKFYMGSMGFNHSTVVKRADTGGNATTLQPYIVVYMWKRIS